METEKKIIKTANNHLPIADGQQEAEINHWISEFGISAEEFSSAEEKGKRPVAVVEDFVQRMATRS